MASAVHIPLADLHVAVRELLTRAKEAGVLFVDGEGTGFKISALPSRSSAEALALIEQSSGANTFVDEEWSSDMQEILALRHTEPVKDLWE